MISRATQQQLFVIILFKLTSYTDLNLRIQIFLSNFKDSQSMLFIKNGELFHHLLDRCLLIGMCNNQVNK